MLQIKFSNRFECLLDTLLDAMATPPASPFVREEIIVPSAALRRRIELAAADRFGICSNVQFSFLAQWLWRQIGQVVDVAEASPFTMPVLTWRVLGIFNEEAFVAGHPPLAAYLRHADAVMRYELAARTAALLEQYLTYRPDWLAAWLAGKPAKIKDLDAARANDERWQGALWRRIARDLGTDSRHPSVAFFDAMKAMGPDAPARAGLPAAAHLFCLPTTPPLYLDILQRLAQWIDLRLYVLNPCREYWFEIVDPQRLSYLAAQNRGDHHEVGNRLLASWGKQTQAHIDLLFQDDSATEVDDADFAPTACTTLLAQVQNTILDMTDFARGSVTLAAGDRSIEVHVCHSITRELEVLQDQLLMLFAGPLPPRPSDILVVMPDLEAAAPLIDAVFGNAPKARTIRYSITGRPASVLNPCAQALLTVLAVATSRFQASAVFELLQQPIIARRFGIGDAEREAIHAWIRDSGIRWGIDGRHRGELGLPEVGRHSFSDGLDRLFLGYALPASATAPVNERLAAGNPEGSAALALGSFREFVRQLEHLHTALARPQTPPEWRQTLLGLIDNFVAPAGDEIDDARETAASIQEFHASMTQGGMTETLNVDVIRTALQALLDDPTRGGMPGGAVTFAAMASLRNLPYRFVCALGLNDGAFPSIQRPCEFDLMARDPRRGDRQRRIDERNVFLDLLLAARERLYLSYTGRSVRDNSPLPPSVLVAELLDYFAAAIDLPPFSPESLRKARHRLIVEHPLQSFSVDYFKPGTDPRRRSFNDEHCEALKQQLARSPAAPVPEPVAAAATADPPPATRTRTGRGNRRRGSSRFLCPKPVRSSMSSRWTTSPASSAIRAATCCGSASASCSRKATRSCRTTSPSSPIGPHATPWRNACCPACSKAKRSPTSATSRVPGSNTRAGRLGDLELDQELQRLDHFAHALVPVLAEPKLAPVSATLELAIDGEPWRLSGDFGDLRKSGLIRYRYDDARASDYLNGWINHLFLNAMAPPKVAAQTTWHSRDGHYVLPPVKEARGQLEALLRLYRNGLHRPLHFFPKVRVELRDRR